MSVLIKGLKLPPVGIRQCIVSFADNCLLITDVCGKILFESEYVEVPTPHGRLIDADRLVWFIDNHIASGKKWVEFETIKDMINSLPTIIEAEIAYE